MPSLASRVARRFILAETAPRFEDLTPRTQAALERLKTWVRGLVERGEATVGRPEFVETLIMFGKKGDEDRMFVDFYGTLVGLMLAEGCTVEEIRQGKHYAISKDAWLVPEKGDNYKFIG